MLFDNSIPYCGSPPAPGSVTWNVDPILWSLLAIGALAYFIACRRLSRDAPARHDHICFALGWIILALALISPICNLSVALFSARVGQHMILSLIAAPLLVLGRAMAGGQKRRRLDGSRLKYPRRPSSTLNCT